MQLIVWISKNAQSVIENLNRYLLRGTRSKMKRTLSTMDQTLDRIRRGLGGNAHAPTPTMVCKRAVSRHASKGAQTNEILSSLPRKVLTASLLRKARTTPTCTYQLNRLLIAESSRYGIVSAGIRPPTPPMTEKNPTGVESAPRAGNWPQPSSADILSAPTPSSVESKRLELLGRYFLKLAVSLLVFQERELSDEGKLTAARKCVVSKRNLASLAVSKKFHEAVESRKFSQEESFGLFGIKSSKKNRENQRRVEYCAGSVNAMVGVCLEKSGPMGALKFLRRLGVGSESKESDSFASCFDLSRDHLPAGCRTSVEETLKKHSDLMEHVERVLGYKFTNRLYLLEALTHRSYRDPKLAFSYERLEFLGDALIDYLVINFLITNHPHLDLRDLDLIRSDLVSNYHFAQLVIKNDLAKCLLHRKPSFSRALLNVSDVSSAGVPEKLGDIMESLVAAVFVDSKGDLPGTYDIFLKLMKRDMVERRE